MPGCDPARTIAPGSIALRLTCFSTTAERMAAALKRAAREWAISHVDVVGPAPAYPPRVRGLWRWHLLLRGDNPRLLLDKVLVPPNWLVDVDPLATA